MPAITVAATGRGLSAGALLAFGGGLALYHSLVLGPAGSRELHLSLTIPAADVAEPSRPLASGAILVLGNLAAPTRAPTPPHRSARPAAPRAAAPTPSPAISPAAPAATPPAAHPSDKPKSHHED